MRTQRNRQEGPGLPRSFVHKARALVIAAGLMLAAAPVLPPGQAEAGGQVRRGKVEGGQYCSITASAQFDACKHETIDDFLVAKSLCINVSDAAQREACFEAADARRAQGDRLCVAQYKSRLDLCKVLGEERYDPDFDPADFERDYSNPTNPNPYFPLTIGYVWNYAGPEETNRIEALDETKLIEDVTCIVLTDRRYVDGLLVEFTDDWYGLRKDGTVDFCGEISRNYHTFPGDNPVEPELLNTDGSWKTGRDGVPSATYFRGSPAIGEAHRQEFAPGAAEDAVKYLSTSYSYGEDPVLDQFVPRELVNLFCDHDCVVTVETTPIEPGDFTHKYYARGVGLILEVMVNTGRAHRLVGCNFDTRCASLPVP